jgi:hypothetical protein
MAALMELDQRNDLRSLRNFLFYAYLDVRPFPDLMALLESQGVQPGERREIPYRSKRRAERSAGVQPISIGHHDALISSIDVTGLRYPLLAAGLIRSCRSIRWLHLRMADTLERKVP